MAVEPQPAHAGSVRTFTEKELADELAVSVQHLQALRRKGSGPRFIRIGERKGIRYPAESVAAWLSARAAHS